MRRKLKLGIILILIIIILVPLVWFSEVWIHNHDYYGIVENKSGVVLVLKSFLTLGEKLSCEGEEVKLPYGYAKVDSASAMGILPAISSMEKGLNKRYTFLEQLGSTKIWLDEETNKCIYINTKRYGGLMYMILYVRDSNVAS